MERIRIAVMGTGIIIRDFHLPILHRHPRVEVVAAANHRRESLERLARSFTLPRIYTDFEKLAADPEVDAVVIGLPNYLHLPVTKMMLTAGKHDLCEKPMAMSVEEARQMRDFALESHGKLMIGHMWRFDHELMWLRKSVKTGSLGRIIKAKAWAVSIREGPDPAGWFTQKRFAGGGAMADMGVHGVDILRYILGDPRPLRVSARAATLHEEIETDDTAEMLIEFEDGVTGIVEAGWYHSYADGQEGHCRVYGTRGFAQALPCRMEQYSEGVWETTVPDMPTRSRPCDFPMYERQIDHFIDCIRDDKRPVPGSTEGLVAMQVIEAAYESARTGKTQEIVSD